MTMKLSGIQKIAVLFAVLGEDGAAKVMATFQADEQERFGQAMVELARLDQIDRLFTDTAPPAPFDASLPAPLARQPVGLIQQGWWLPHHHRSGCHQQLSSRCVRSCVPPPPPAWRRASSS